MSAHAIIDALREMNLMGRAMQPMHSFCGSVATQRSQQDVQRPRGPPARHVGGARVSDRLRDRVDGKGHAITQRAIGWQRERAAANNREAQRHKRQRAQRDMAKQSIALRVITPSFREAVS